MTDLSVLHKDNEEEGLFWIKIGGNNEKAIGGNSDVYIYKGRDARGNMTRQSLMIDLGTLFLNRKKTGYDEAIPDARPFIIKENDPNYDPFYQIDALLLTHGHMDHVGGIPHYIKEGYKIPKIYGTPLTIKSLLADLQLYGIDQDKIDALDIEIIEPWQEFRVGLMRVIAEPVPHSYAGSVRFKVHTPVANFCHSGDAKVDPTTPLDQHKAPAHAKKRSQEDYHALFMDSTGSQRPGRTIYEEEVYKNLKALAQTHPNKRIIFVVMSNNHQRLATISRIASEVGRTIVPVGWSIKRSMRAMEQSGHDMRAKYGTRIVSSMRNRGKRLKNKDQILLATGTQGEEIANLFRAANDDHHIIKLDPKNDVVYISAMPIPGNEAQYNKVLKLLADKGVEVCAPPEFDIHSSGHNSSGDYRKFYNNIKPQTVVPVHGGKHQIDAQANLARKLGYPVFLLHGNHSVVQLTTKGLEHRELRRGRWIGVARLGDLSVPKFSYHPEKDDLGREASNQNKKSAKRLPAKRRKQTKRSKPVAQAKTTPKQSSGKTVSQKRKIVSRRRTSGPKPS